MPSIVASETRLGSNIRTVSATFTGYTPQAGDLILIFAVVPTDDGVPSTTVPSGWSTLVQVGNAGGSLSSVYHVVTSGEASAATTTYTATNYYNLAKNWRSVSCVVRGGDPLNLIDAIGTTNGGNASPHPTAALSGADLVSGSLALAVVGSGDSPRAYSGAPSGWSLIVQNDSGVGIAMWARTAATTAGVGVPSENVTIDTAAWYTSISVAVGGVVAASSGAFFALF